MNLFVGASKISLSKTNKKALEIYTTFPSVLVLLYINSLLLTWSEMELIEIHTISKKYLSTCQISHTEH